MRYLKSRCSRRNSSAVIANEYASSPVDAAADQMFMVLSAFDRYQSGKKLSVRYCQTRAVRKNEVSLVVTRSMKRATSSFEPSSTARYSS